MNAVKILKRHENNPLITPDMMPKAMVTFNPSPVMYNDETILVLSVYQYGLEKEYPYGGYIARSSNGVDFSIDNEPLIDLKDAPYPFNVIRSPMIDNRISCIDGIYYLLTPCFYKDEGPFVLMGKTEDFKKYEPLDIVTCPSNRGCSMFPEKINGKYYRLERPSASGSLWISSSPDMFHWGSYRPFLQPGYTRWNRLKIGPTPPLKTSEGWLEIVHGVWEVASGRHYYISALLMDIDNPLKIIGKMNSWLLAPEEPYECCGTVNSIVFPCGAIADEQKDELRLYYGGADTVVGLASGKLSEVIYACKNEL